MTDRPVIWLFRDDNPDDRYARAFENAGFETVLIPVLRTELSVAPETIPPADSVVVTSARAVDAVRGWDQVEDLKPLRWFAVGSSTRRAIEDLGIPVERGSSGTAESLADAVVEAGARRVLFLAGDPHRPELPTKLRRNGVVVETAVVYRTHPHVLKLPKQAEAPDWVAFFSPRGVRIVAEQASTNLDQSAKAAIGPTTAKAIGDVGWVADAVASSPSPGSLLDAVRSFEHELH